MSILSTNLRLLTDWRIFQIYKPASITVSATFDDFEYIAGLSKTLLVECGPFARSGSSFRVVDPIIKAYESIPLFTYGFKYDHSDRKEHFKACRLALPADHQAAVFLLEPSKCALASEAGNHVVDRSTTKLGDGGSALAHAGCCTPQAHRRMQRLSLSHATTLCPIRRPHACLTSTISTT